jgi:SAM-dependent methyltransferase
MLGRFNADTSALRVRENLNAALAARNLEEWIAGCAQPRRGERVLDIGCGTGKQIFDLAQRVDGLAILGIDISEDAVAAVRRRARDDAVLGVEAERLGIDDCVERLAPRAFDLILSTYAIYYASDLRGTVERLSQLLRSGGRAFLSGPGAGTNRELIRIVRAVAADDAAIGDIDDFIGADRIEAARRHWGAVELHRLDNQIAFPSVEAVRDWWRNHNSYRPELESGVASALARVVARDGAFRLTKNVLGILLKRT